MIMTMILTEHLFYMFFYIGAHLCDLNTNQAKKFAHVMRLTYARWCACPTDNMYMNKQEYVCLRWRLTGKHDITLIALSIQYILHLKKNPSHQD